MKSIDVYTKNPNKNITDLERFQCGGFDIGGAKLTKETKQCKTGPVFSQFIKSETHNRTIRFGLNQRLLIFFALLTSKSQKKKKNPGTHKLSKLEP